MLFRQASLLLSVAALFAVLLPNPGGTDSGDGAGGGARGQTFACGPKVVCNPTTQYCSRSSGGPVGVPEHYSCVPLPKNCPPTPTCGCIQTEIGCTCTESGGHITVICTAP